MKDHREAIDDFSKVEASLETIRLKGRGPWIEVEPARQDLDLALYTDGRSVAVFDGEVESGPYEGLDLKFQKVLGTLRKDNAGIELKNEVRAIQLPFSVEPRSATLVVVDLKVMDLSDHPGRGYELHLNGYEIYRGGRLVDKIPPG